MDNNKSYDDVELVQLLQKSIKEVKTEISKVIVGQEETIDNLLTSLLARGHCMLVGVPGLAKTLLIKTLSEVLDLDFNRIQFTPDLMPSDITGTEILEEDQTTKKRDFKFIKGPIFANIILADEINRTPPKTQSALLEAMQEQNVTAAGRKYNLPNPFFVLATQNPIEQEGTYPLPEAQLDRFMFNLWLDYPSFDEEVQIIKQTTSSRKISLEKKLPNNQILAFQDLVRRVPVADNVIQYAVNAVKLSRPTNENSLKEIKELISWGAGPRASQYLILAAKTYSILDGRYTPEIDDVKRALIPVLRHRIIPSFNAEAEGITSIDIINKLITK
ncbi:MAG: MoxR family ATPase [Ignavibacteriales bacterium]|nr:MoxR family ATPase [Ignavibacteriota bacterium]MCB9249152.1 MoxR family ATPase [Ignavibacteriales bacterium]